MQSNTIYNKFTIIDYGSDDEQVKHYKI